ncbi:MAG TPA: Rieske 2Fe-2S domain-containing protein [Acidimicrobiia bacterium]|nr:Rieske 2Fe-2S domain-containing protein [Acidimicrobiia bacterium]
MGFAIAIIAILVVAAITVIFFVSRGGGAATGALSRETRRRDSGASSEPELSTSTELEATGRERADETRESLGGGLMRRRRGEVVEYEPVDEEELGVTRRQFFNRALGLLTLVGVGSFGAAVLGFLWPLRGQAGFGSKVKVDKTIPDIQAYIAANQKPYYVAEARAYIVEYPADTLNKAKKVYAAAVYTGMEHGIVALWQRCVHLGCRVPFCPTSQWFECPCHGSKYNRVGEKKAGPAPRGLDRFLPIIDGDSLTVDTGTIFTGPPIGTDTTGQQQEGPLCV